MRMGAIGTNPAHGLNVRRQRGQTGAGAGNNQGIGPAAFPGVARCVLQRFIAQRNGMFDMDIGQNLGLRTKMRRGCGLFHKRCLE